MLASNSSQSETFVGDCYVIRVGVVGQIGRFRAMELKAFERGDRVLCRTARGLEVGEVLGPARITDHQHELSEEGTRREDWADGRVLRSMRSEDELLWGHLRQLGQEAHAECERWLRENEVSAALLDVEPLMDGKTLYFHFLSEAEERVQPFLDELVAVYERQVRQSQFAKLLEHGCGPGCGTAEAKNGCGARGGCAVCKVASACRQRKA